MPFFLQIGPGADMDTTQRKIVALLLVVMLGLLVDMIGCMG